MKFFKKHSDIFTFVFVFAIGLFLRMYNLNWDQGLLFHPDERNIANAVTKIHFWSQLNPGFFAYGGFSIYLYRATADILVKLTHDPSWVTDWGKIDVVGRFFSALFSSLTTVPLFYLAKKLFGKKTALLSVLLYVFTVTSIQNAHFSTTESAITFFGVLLCLVSLWWMEKPTTIKSVLLGVAFGTSIATKTSAFLTILFPFFALIIVILQHKKSPKKLISLVPYSIIFLIISAFFAFLLSPFSLLDFKDFYSSMQYESGVATGSLPVVYTLQFNGSIPYIFQIENFVWQLGPLLTIFAITGFVFVILERFRKKEKNRLIFWIYPLIYFIYVGDWHTKFLRYMVPIIPFFIISASYLLAHILERYKKIGYAVVLLTVLTTICWAFAFFSIYTRPQTRVVASIWIYQHVKPGSTILTEAWDDGLPNPIGSETANEYNLKQLDMYSTDNTQKIIYLSSMLSSADYISISSKRLYATLIRLTPLYPITSKYYKLLFAGKLGYKEVAIFTSYPQIFGIQIHDDSAEETFQVFDHTRIFIFKKTERFSQNKIAAILEK